MFLLGLYAGVVSVLAAGALYLADRTSQTCKEYRKLTTQLLVELQATKASALVVSMWNRAEQAEKAWLS